MDRTSLPLSPVDRWVLGEKANGGHGSARVQAGSATDTLDFVTTILVHSIE